jgi:hypothetical protein
VLLISLEVEHVIHLVTNKGVGRHASGNGPTQMPHLKVRNELFPLLQNSNSDRSRKVSIIGNDDGTMPKR